MDATLAIVIGAAVALQALQTAQIAILRRDVRRTLYPPPPPPPPAERFTEYANKRMDDHRCAVCGGTLTREELVRASRGGRKLCSAHY